MRARCVVTMMVVAALGVGACSSDHTTSAGNASSSSAAAVAAGAAPVDRPAGPAADLSARAEGGNGVFLPGGTAPTGYGPPPAGYDVGEYVASGTATSYRADGALSSDGRWNFVPDSSAPYRTRVVVRRPSDPARFSGKVIVEWLNVSGGVDAGPDYDTLQEEITRAAMCGSVSPRRLIGVMGGPVLVKAPGAGGSRGKGLVNIDPAGTARCSIPVTGTRSTSTPRSRAPSPRWRAARWSAAAAPHRRGGIAVGVRSGDVHQRRRAAHPGVRRVLRAQSRRERSSVGRARSDLRASLIRWVVALPSSAPIRTSRSSMRRPRAIPGCSDRSRPANPMMRTSGCGRSLVPRTLTRTCRAVSPTNSIAACR